MGWQDATLSVGGVILGITLIPMILANKRMAFCNTPYKSSVTTAIIMYIYFFTYWTLDLGLTSFTTLIVAVGWTIISFQRWYYK